MQVNVDQKTVEGFGDEWDRLNQSLVPDNELERLFLSYFSIFPWQDIPADAQGFDMGCGSGRWAKFVADRVKLLYCIDPSEKALNVAKINLSGKGNCRFLQSSMDEIDIEDNSMDFGYCLGVLHHVPDTLAGLKSCAAKLKNNAPFLVYIYHALETSPWWYKGIWKISEVFRDIVSSMPYTLRYWVTQSIAFLVYLPLARTALLLERMGVNIEHFPLSFYRNLSFYTMRTDALDRFGTRLEKRFTLEQIIKLMNDAGFQGMVVSDSKPQWCVLGYKSEKAIESVVEYTPKILLLCPYPHGVAPSQRFRFEQYLDVMESKNYQITIEAFLTPEVMKILYRSGHVFEKSWGVISAFWRRFKMLLTIGKYDYIFIHREAAPLGPPIIEAILCAFHPRVIFDFDDAIFIKKTSDVNWFVSFIKWPSKIRYISKKCWKVAVCNQYLVNWVKQYNQNVTLLPTTIDLAYHRPMDKDDTHDNLPIIGWTGTRSTMGYLDLVREALAILQQKYEFRFRVICDVDPKFPGLQRYEFVKWNKDTEIHDLAEIDIGLMPVPQGEWELGKVGFKAIQYSGVEAVPVVSCTGSGNEVVKHGITGYVIENNTEAWVSAISSLLEDREKIARMGRQAREYIDATYSVRSQQQTVLGLFKEMDSEIQKSEIN